MKSRSAIILAIVALLAGLCWLMLRARTGAHTGTEEARFKQSPQPVAGPAMPALVSGLLVPGRHQADRLEDVRHLPEDLSDLEKNSFADLLAGAQPAGLSASDWYELVNELMFVLRRPGYAWDDYGNVMARLMRDRHADPVVRDYAAQHLGLWLLDNDLPDERKVPLLRSYLDVVCGEREAAGGQVLGTSLLGLCNLVEGRGQEFIEPIREELSQAVAALADGTMPASSANRVSSIQASARLGLEASRPAIRKLASDPGADPSLRLSSVAALGYFGGDGDRILLQELADGDGRFRFAAREALSKISKNSIISNSSHILKTQ